MGGCAVGEGAKALGTDYKKLKERPMRGRGSGPRAIKKANYEQRSINKIGICHK